MQNVQKPYYLWLGVGLLLLIIGLAGDCFTGMALLTHPGRKILIWHIPAAIVWALGVNFVSLRNTQPEVASAEKHGKQRYRRYIRWSGLAALFLGLGTFPGFGSLAYSIALVIGKFSRRRPGMEAQEELSLQAEVPPLPVEVSPSLDWLVQPLVDTLQVADIETRRTAVAVLDRYGSPQTTQLLRQLLSDPQDEIRADASIALSRLDDECSQALNLALEHWTANPTDNALALTLAEECYRYACSNILDQTSQHFYLERARDLLAQISIQVSNNADLWLKLAQVRARLGEPHEALQDAQVSLRHNPRSAEAAVLAMELAFRLHAWDTLVALADRQAATLLQEATSTASLRWWKGLKSELQKEVLHG